ncbi:MAG: FAD-dependent oxidoreductase [Sarcina sp.]
MKHLEIKKDIYWVGALDPNLRVFDIIMYTPYGTTYNSYVVKGSEKTAVFETVKVQFFDQYLERLESLGIKPSEIDYIVVDHTEPDHSGSVSKLLKLAPNAKIVGSKIAIDFLKDIANEEFDYIVVNHKDTLSLGNKTLEFISAPFLHWPDSMYTYIPEDKILITCDSFGSHYSCEEIFNDLLPNKEQYMEALRYYYDCIFGPYKPYVLKGIEKIKDLDIDIICPGHGPILRDNPQEIIETYKKWSTPEEKVTEGKKVTICYVSAYGYSKELAENIALGIKENHNVEVKLYDVIHHKMEDILADIADSDGILFGSPTIVGDLLPPIRDILTNLNPIVHGGKFAAAFGSYGWSGEAVPNVENRLEELRMKIYGPGMRIKFKPSDAEIEEAKEFGDGFSSFMFGEKTVKYSPHKKAMVEELEGPSDGSMKHWKCLVCGEIFESPTVPEVCPVCGAGSDQFIEVENESLEEIHTDERFVIIGNGASGFYAAKTLREINKTASIVMISAEKVSSYSRPQLSDLISDDSLETTIYLESQKWYTENNITQILSKNVLSIDKDEKSILFDDNSQVSYDKLILANGSHNFVPPANVKALDNSTELTQINTNNYKDIKGIYSIKDIEDVLNVKEDLKSVKNVVVIGGGALGLEAASEIKSLGVNVKVLEFMPYLMNNQLDVEAAEFFNGLMVKSGLDFKTSESIKEILVKDNKVISLDLNSGNNIDCDMLIFSTGIRSNIELAKTADIEVNRGVLVNNKMLTNVKDIYACGDVAEFNGIVYGNWPAAIEMGKTAAVNAAGLTKEFKNFTPSIILSAFDEEMISIGLVNFKDETLERLTIKDEVKGNLTKLFFKKDILVGAIVIGDLSASAKLIVATDNQYSKRDALIALA